MPAITRFREAEAREGKDARGYVYIDGQYCTSVRARTFAGMGLTVDQEISCDQVKRLEKYHFKLQYQGSWEKEKQRIDGVRQRIETICPAVETRVVGFGADTTEFIEAHPETAGKPDLDIAPRGRPDIVLLSIEVTGTEYRRGKGFPDYVVLSGNYVSATPGG